MNAVLLTLLLAARPQPGPCAGARVGFDGGVALPPAATRFDGPRLSEAASRCLVEIGGMLAARGDVVGVTVTAAHDRESRVDGLQRAQAVKLALETGGLRAAAVSTVGLSSGTNLEILVRTGKSGPPPAVVALAEGGAALLAPGTPLGVGAPLNVPRGGRVVVLLLAGGEVELEGGSEAKINGPRELELVAGSAAARGEGVTIRTRFGLVHGGGRTEVTLRDGAVLVAAVQGIARLEGLQVREGHGLVAGKSGGPREQPLLAAPGRAPLQPGPGPAGAGFAPVEGAHHYQAQVAADPDFVTEVRSEGLAPAADGKLASGKQGFLRLRGVAEDGLTGRWSAVRALPLATAAPRE